MKKILTLMLTSLVAGNLPAHAGTQLVELTPTKIEYGMIAAVGPLWGLATGPGVIDCGTWGGRRAMPWPDARKILKAVKQDQQLPEGQAYSSFLPDAAAVQGDFVTGVCLLAMSNGMYHWSDYDVPSGAKKFTAKVFVTDDVGGIRAHIVAGQAVVNQDFLFRVFVDGKPRTEKHFNRMQVGMGSGTLVENVALDLPAGAKTIRFHLESTTFPDNIHNEIVITGGSFE